MWTRIIIWWIQHAHAHKYFSEEVGNCCTPNCACFKWHLTCAYILDNSNHWSSYKWNNNEFYNDLARFSRIIVFSQKMVSRRLLHIISNSWRHFHKKWLRKRKKSINEGNVRYANDENLARIKCPISRNELALFFWRNMLHMKFIQEFHL